MKFQKDFVELLQELKNEKCEFVVVGAHAMVAYGYVRATGDLDILILPNQVNGERVYRALAKFGAPLKSVTPADFAQAGQIYQIGLPPVRIDILTRIEGITAERALAESVSSTVCGVSVKVLSLDCLLKNKKAVGRPKDVADVITLTKMKGKNRAKKPKG